MSTLGWAIRFEPFVTNQRALRGVKGAEREVGASTELGQGKCFVAVIPWAPGLKVNTKEGRKTPNWLNVSSSSEE